MRLACYERLPLCNRICPLIRIRQGMVERMEKMMFVFKEELDDICSHYQTPFHLYDERGMRQTVEDLLDAFSWNEGFRE